MKNFKDRTEEFRDAVLTCARNHQYDEEKLRKISEAFIIRRPHKKSPFIQMALKTLESIQTLHEFIVTHKKDYVDQHRTTERDRDTIEHEVLVFVKACKEQIDMLNKSIDINVQGQRKPSVFVQEDLNNADIIAHKHGVVLILSEHLHDVTAQFDQLRTLRFQAIIDKKLPKRTHRIGDKSSSLEKSAIRDPNMTELKNKQRYIGEPKERQMQQLDEETRALQVELTNLMDAVEETEAKMIEMSALNHLFSTHVLQQAQQIEYLYEQAVQATENVSKGNEELTKAIDRNRSSRTFILLFLAILPLSLLFLDWYQ
eukprot:TRINITY_DN3818_c0_g1_i2.p1 TRINITY_DN3818_c0_g1~~TRINITY_DN3818_c0_g1_i2.p1  ORF type:complete len:314 (-),score=59.99 TRINITY_DN3818_c0_g1_i2:94-1035(-)